MPPRQNRRTGPRSQLRLTVQENFKRNLRRNCRGGCETTAVHPVHGEREAGGFHQPARRRGHARSSTGRYRSLARSHRRILKTADARTPVSGLREGRRKPPKPRPSRPRLVETKPVETTKSIRRRGQGACAHRPARLRSFNPIMRCPPPIWALMASAIPALKLRDGWPEIRSPAIRRPGLSHRTNHLPPISSTEAAARAVEACGVGPWCAVARSAAGSRQRRSWRIAAPSPTSCAGSTRARSMTCN